MHRTSFIHSTMFLAVNIDNLHVASEKLFMFGVQNGNNRGTAVE